MTDYFLFAGEMSGDLHGSHLIQTLKRRQQHASFAGVGGPLMRHQPFSSLLPMECFQVMGFSEVIRAWPRLCRLFFHVRNHILQTSPDCLILIDYPGFNLRLARALRQRGFKGKIVQYVCPTIWAHGRRRLNTLTAYFDLVLAIFPFESAYFAHTRLPVKYIGNPLTELIRRHTYQPDWMQRIGFPPTDHLIALFPGSRQGEIERHAPLQLQVAAHMQQRHPYLKFALACAHPEMHAALQRMIATSPLKLHQDICLVPPNFRYELMQTCHTALAKSGTVTLELALHGVPTLVHYELSLLNYGVAKYFLRLNLPHYCIVNILEKKTVFPEYIGRNIPLEDLHTSLTALHFDRAQRAAIATACAHLAQQLGQAAPSEAAAQAILELMSC